MSHICYYSIMEKIKTKLYKLSSGKEPFTDWIETLDATMIGIIFDRLARVRTGNFGACKPLKGYHGLYEIVIDVGPGYRIYYGILEKSGLIATLLLILTGGDKGNQKRDIEIAYRYWNNHKEEHS
jgi:putative addiction module killer protein